MLFNSTTSKPSYHNFNLNTKTLSAVTLMYPGRLPRNANIIIIIFAKYEMLNKSHNASHIAKTLVALFMQFTI